MRSTGARVEMRSTGARVKKGSAGERGEIREFIERVELARRYMIFREDGKFYLMVGYDLLRDVALEAAKRIGAEGDDVFHLTLEELFDALRLGFAPSRLIAQRKTQYEAEARLDVPAVIDSAAIDGIGQPPKVSSAACHQAFAVSSGVATGAARIVHSPEQAGDLGKGYILVCPSTDPGWTPLFVNAAGLVLECGGTLSHGAVIAREMNIPAVVLSGATRIFRDGESIVVDGRNGMVGRADEMRSGLSQAGPSADDARIAPELVPPVPGKGERRAARVRNVFFIVWGVYLLAAFLLPQQWVYDPTIALFDVVLWPVVRILGRPATVAIVAGAMAIGTMVLQRVLTDNARLREAKRRSTILMHQVGELPKGSARRNAMLALAGPVQMRVMAAAFVPLAVILGPMVMSFMWLPQRVDPAVAVAPPDSTIEIQADVDSDYRRPLTASLSGPLEFAPGQEAPKKLQPIREAMKKMYKELDNPGATESPALRSAAKPGRESLKASMDGKLPPQQITWKLRSDGQTAGRFGVTIRAGERDALRVNVVLGDKYPPENAKVMGDGVSPLISATVKCTPPNKQSAVPRFWTPIASKPNWDVGWLMTYLVVYVPAMFGMKWALRVV